MAATPATPARTRTPGQVFAGVFGAIYILIGIVGFFVTGFDNWTGNTGEELIIFEINPLHNVVHIVIGLAFLAGAASPGAARSMNTLIGVAYLAVAILRIPGWLDWLAIDDGLAPDFWLHAGTGALALAFGLMRYGPRTA
jgi:tryptophan-rich sensory protein